MTLKGRVRGDTPRPRTPSANLMAIQTDNYIAHTTQQC